MVSDEVGCCAIAEFCWAVLKTKEEADREGIVWEDKILIILNNFIVGQLTKLEGIDHHK